MIEVYPRVYVGEDEECFEGGGEWFVVHACKHPCWHKQKITELWKLHPHEDLWLNLVDAENIKYFRYDLIDYAVERIKLEWNLNKKIFIHCNAGTSRAPSLALLFIAGKYNDDFKTFMKEFSGTRYPQYRPGPGMWSFVCRFYEKFRAREVELE